MIRHRPRTLALVAALCAAVGLLSGGAALGAPPASGSAGRGSTALTDETVYVGAVGDIACEREPGTNPRACQYDDVGTLAQGAELDAFLALGDVQYETGELTAFQSFYDPWFGPLGPITHPVPGNHEYDGTNTAAEGYFSYFGASAGAPGAGYYSYDLGGWHLIALNSELCYRTATNRCRSGTAQYDWLQADLAAHPNESYPCTLAYWHHPRFISTPSGLVSDPNVKPLWDLLYAARTDLVLNGHAHNYQRWKQTMPTGAVEEGRGIRQIIVGTGGKNFHAVGAPSGAFVRGQDKAYGILKLTLKPGTYGYRWLSAPGQPSWRDRASALSCV